MLKNLDIPEEIKKVSRNIKIVCFGETVQKKGRPMGTDYRQNHNEA